MDFENLLYFLYMEEQEKTEINRSENEKSFSSEDRPPKTETPGWKIFLPGIYPPGLPGLMEPERTTAEDIKSLTRDKQFFTKSELLDMIGHELDGTFGKPDFKALWQMIKSLLCHKYYKTVKEAESH